MSISLCLSKRDKKDSRHLPRITQTHMTDLATASAAITLTPVDFSDRTLANGLRVLLVEDHRTPSVAINVGYRVGGKDDPPGRSGFAHLFEHLMFKSTRRMPSEFLDRLKIGRASCRERV